MKMRTVKIRSSAKFLMILLMVGVAFAALPILARAAETTDPNEAVAQVGSGESAKYYTTLQSAIDAAPDKGTVTLTKDCAENITITKNVKIDLNGHTLTNANNGYTIDIEDEENASAPIKVTITNGTIKNTSGNPAIYCKVKMFATRPNITISNATVETSGSTYCIVNHGNEMHLNDVTVKSDDSNTILVENGYDTYPSVSYNPRLFIDGSSFTGGKYAVRNDIDGVLTINSGTFSSPIENIHECYINGGTFKGSPAIYNGRYTKYKQSEGQKIWEKDTAAWHQGELEIKNGTFQGNTILGLSDESEFAAALSENQKKQYLYQYPEGPNAQPEIIDINGKKQCVYENSHTLCLNVPINISGGDFSAASQFFDDNAKKDRDIYVKKANKNKSINKDYSIAKNVEFINVIGGIFSPSAASELEGYDLGLKDRNNEAVGKKYVKVSTGNTVMVTDSETAKGIEDYTKEVDRDSESEASYIASLQKKVSELQAEVDKTKEGIPMFRLYNPNSGEHFYTKDTEEAAKNILLGWRDEGVGWVAPKTGEPVYRLYNKYAGEHHYTKDDAEVDHLIKVGWTYEGIGWYSGGKVAVYREYNPNERANNHNYTADKAEHDHLVSIGWRNENIGWYAEAAGK